jgi:hypothetical protein
MASMLLIQKEKSSACWQNRDGWRFIGDWRLPDSLAEANMAARKW